MQGLGFESRPLKKNPDLNPKMQDFATLFTFNDSNPLQNPKIGKIPVKSHEIVKSIQNRGILKGFEGLCPIFSVIYV